MLDEKNENYDEDEKKKDNNIEIINGDGTDLNISPVYNHIKLDKTNKEQKKEIIIPKEKDKK